MTNQILENLKTALSTEAFKTEVVSTLSGTTHVRLGHLTAVVDISIPNNVVYMHGLGIDLGDHEWSLPAFGSQNAAMAYGIGAAKNALRALATRVTK